jgi:SAM-dependent methyltransferase
VKIHRIKKSLGFLSNTPFHPQWLMSRGKAVDLGEKKELLQGVILDLGCGNRLPEKFITDSARYIGLDYYYTATELYHSQPDVFANAESLPFADKSINTVLLLDVLEHLPGPNRCLQEIYRVLVTGGSLVIHVPFIYPIHDSPLDFHRWTQFGLHNLIKQAGFKVQTETALGNPLVTAGLIMNLSLSKTFINSVEKLNPGILLIFFLPLLIPLINIACYILAYITPADNFMPFKYHVIASKDAV